ncbi:esterase [Serratia sp. S1B]|nr:esterase [Serratia sp. S1B]
MKLLMGSYDNGSTVQDEKAILLSFQSQSRAIYQQEQYERNIPYGDSTREVFDWFYSPSEYQGTLIFIHGGYWQWCNKEDFAFIAKNPLALGFDVVLVEYGLAPVTTLIGINQQIGMALDAIEQRTKQRGNKPVYLVGHSAGGHLAALWQHHPGVQAVFPISGIFELQPLINSEVNRNLQLTRQQIADLSPARHIPLISKPLYLFYGAEELPELIGQSLYYYSLLQQKERLVGLYAVPDTNHFSVLETLFSAESALYRQWYTYGETTDANHH